MSANQQLLAEIDAFLEATGMSETTFGQKAMHQWKVVSRLRSGGSVTLTTAERLRKFIRENLPDEKPRKRVA